MSRVGLLMPPGRNRELLGRALSDRDLDVVVAAPDALDAALDLLVTDARTLERTLPDGPDLPPTVVLVRRHERRVLPQHILSAAAAVITVPAPQRELVDRITRLAFARSQVEEERKALQGHLAHINHELRTPLQAVLAFAELLDEDGLNPVQTEHLNHITTGGKRMLDLVDGLLEYSRAESGHLAADCREVDLAALVAEAVATIRPLTAKRDLRIRVGEPNGPVPAAWADPVHTGRVLLNLLSNAVKYNRPGGRVDIDLQATDGMVSVRVADTGSGIAADDLERIFLPYERLRTSAPGTGLGLPYARLLAEKMNGTLAVTSVLGGGSSFTLELPRAGSIESPGDPAT